MKRISAVLAALLLSAIGAGVGAAPAGAIETASFGMAPAGDHNRTALHEEVRPGRSVEDGVRIWNKTDEPVTVALAVQGAMIDSKGKVSLGGNEGAVSWVRLSTSRITLAPRGSAVVPVSVHAPRNLPRAEATAAVMAERVSAGAADVAVVQRVALMVYVKAPAGSPLRAALGWIAAVAVGLLVVVMAYGLRIRQLRNRRARRHSLARQAGAAWSPAAQS
jgi:hypothetical protein